jgi:outer membrane protein OmpA-like peptidoglycan-associated protein
MLSSSWFARLAAIAVLTSLTTVSISVTPAEAQFGKKLKERLKRNTEDKAIDKAVEKENEAIDNATTGGGTSADTARATAAPTAPGSTEAAQADTSSKTAAASAAPSAADSSPSSKQMWANYDFVPGQRTLYFTDFTEDQVGNFPQRLKFKNGQMEIVEFEGGRRALKASSASTFTIPLPEVLPQKFTLEFDVINRKTQGVAANTITVVGGTEGTSNDKSLEIGWGHNGLATTGGGLENQWIASKDADKERYVGHPASFRILADGNNLKAYVDEKRLANFPGAQFDHSKAITVKLEGRDDEDNAVYLTRIRVAESQKSIYDALSSTGRWTTQGILFDTGKSSVKPESTPTLKEIATTLKQHPDLKVEVQGHTDNVGKPDANLQLSQARADAVKQTLTTEYGVPAGQLTAKGYGDTKPTADNKTAEGRANNRRVELVKS